MFVPIFYGDVIPEGDTKLECSSWRGQGQQEDKLATPVRERRAGQLRRVLTSLLCFW